MFKPTFLQAGINSELALPPVKMQCDHLGWLRWLVLQLWVDEFAYLFRVGQGTHLCFSSGASMDAFTESNTIFSDLHLAAILLELKSS